MSRSPAANGRLAAPPTPHIRRQWLPLCLLLVHGREIETTLRCTPCHLFSDEALLYSVELRVFGSDPLHPIYTKQSGSISLFDVFSVTSAEVASATGARELFCYVEEYSRIVDQAPPNAVTTLNTQAHYASKDGSYHGHIGGIFIFGAPRKMLKGAFYYENFPGVSVADGMEFSAFLLNPFTRSAQYSILLVDAFGRTYESEPEIIPGKGAARWSSRGRDLSALSSPCGAVVRSTLKLASFFASHDADGRMVSMDHGHPFLAEVLKH